jgi:excisionase family DNA binding protein
MIKSYYTTHEVSKLCNVYPTTVINWINEGRLVAFATPGGHRRVKKENIIDLMHKNSMPIPDELLSTDKIKVLAVDDDAKICKMIKIILEAQENIEVALANNGFESGVMVFEWKPDIILLDFRMPGIDGFEVCRRLKQNAKTKSIPVIAVTALRDANAIKRMYKSGVSDYLAKPFKSQSLIDAVKKHFPITAKI